MRGERRGYVNLEPWACVPLTLGASDGTGRRGLCEWGMVGVEGRYFRGREAVGARHGAHEPRYGRMAMLPHGMLDPYHTTRMHEPRYGRMAMLPHGMLDPYHTTRMHEPRYGRMAMLPWTGGCGSKAWCS